ncbi:TPA: GNAT family N-acetyltransferase, partial [Candidatus Bathyarchaeota archaeon]|nr:GNAT family N-acetyltransferase [Candidatus Bathyarchaeota archaeon]
ALEIIKEQPVYGIFADSTLVSAATFHVRLPEIWIIGGLYTRPEYRNLGYATSITSVMVKDALWETGCIGLYVREDNHPAKRVYEKTGFRPYKKIKWLDCNTGLAP